MKVFSPIYLLRSSEQCWRCHTVQPVVALATKHLIDDPEYEDEEGDSLEGQVLILSSIETIPQALLDCIHSRHGKFEKRKSKTANCMYYMNICGSCGAHFGDFYMHSEPGGAFFPSNEIEAATVTIEQLPLTGEFDIGASYGIGSGDLIFECGKRLN